MTSPKISVIVPVYNTEKYLRRCVDSILGQTFTDFELLLVDDGSTDGSGAICDEYAGIDGRVRVFHKPNGGVSSARNLGLDNARGEWITFVDSDDYIDEKFISDLASRAECDLVVGNYQVFGEINSLDLYHIPKGKYQDASIGELMMKYTFPNFAAPWAKFFKKDIIDSLNLRFNINLTRGEDTIFVLYYLQNVDTLASVGHKSKYHYLLAPGGANSQYDLDCNKVFTREFISAFSKLSRKFNLSEDEFYPHYSRGNISSLFPKSFVNDSYRKVVETLQVLKNDEAIKHYFNVLQRNNCGIKAKMFFKLYNANSIALLMIWMRFCKMVKKKFV